MAWLTVLAVFLGSIAPVVAHAFRGSAVVDGWVEVCSAAGAKWIKVDPASQAPQPKSSGGHDFGHCPYCSLHATALGMPPAPVAFAAATDLIASAIRFDPAPAPARAQWQPAQARGPPVPSRIV